MALKKIVHTGMGRESFKKCTTTVQPGALLKRTAIDTVIQNDVAASDGTQQELLIAKENSLQGDEVGTVIPINTQCPIYHPQKGDEVYLLLEDGEVTVFGSYLEQNSANGTVTVGTTNSIARALEAKDALSDAQSVDLLVRCVIT